MHRWRHAGRGPKAALLAGVVLGIASVVLFQAAYAAAEPPYPGNPGLPGIPNGPSLGCNNPHTSNETWVCGFDPQSTITFKVNGHFAGTATADSNGCVIFVLTFLKGEVAVNGNEAVPVTPGQNFLVVEGPKTTGGVTQTVGLRLPFSTPAPGKNQCTSKVSPPGSTTTTTLAVPTSTSFPLRPPVTRFPVETTIHGFYPTTLAKVIETPLEISPNKVILESSLLAAVLAAVLSAGALGAIWAAGERGGGGEPAGPVEPTGPAPAGAPAGPGSAGAASPPGDPTGLGVAGGAAAGPAGQGTPSAFQRPGPGGPSEPGGAT